MNARQKIKKLKRENAALNAILGCAPFNEPFKYVVSTHPDVRKYKCRIEVPERMREEVAISKFVDALKQNLTYKEVLYNDGMYPCYEVSVYIGKE